MSDTTSSTNEINQEKSGILEDTLLEEAKSIVRLEGQTTTLFQQENTDFEKFKTQLEGNPAFDDLKHEYDKLHKALLLSHENEMKFVKDIKSLFSEISASQGPANRSENEETIMASRRNELQEDIKELVTKVHRSKETEELKKLELIEFEKKFETYKLQIAPGTGWTDDQESEINKLKSLRDDAQEQFEVAANELSTLQFQLHDLLNEITLLSNERDELKTNYELVESEINELSLQCTREQDRKKELDNELKIVRNKTTIINDTIEERNKQILILSTDSENRFQQITNDRNTLVETEKLIKGLEVDITKYQKSLDDKIRENMKLLQFNQQRKEIISEENLKLNNSRRELHRLNKLIKQGRKRLAEVSEEHKELINRKITLEDEIRLSIQDASNSKLAVDSYKRKFEDSTREKEILQKSINKAIDVSQSTKDLIMVYENYKLNLENDISYFINTATKQQELIKLTELERDKYDRECIESNQRYFAALEDVKLQDLHISQLQKKILEFETKLKQQHNMYETVRTERNLHSKNLLEAHEAISEMKRRFKLMNTQIDSYKEEITYKDHLLVQEHFDHHKVEKEKEVLRNDLSKVKKQIECSEKIIDNQSTEIEKLHSIITEAEAEQIKQKKEYEAVQSERDLLNNQLIQRNRELSSLYEKIRVQKSTLQKGEQLFVKKINELKELQLKLGDAQNLLDLEKIKIKDLDGMKKTEIQLTTELINEKAKVSALQEEMEHPINVHRYRNLEHTDPESYQLINKINRIQKIFIDKSKEYFEKDLLVAEKEKLYVELKQILSRQPGPEIDQQIKIYQESLKEKRQDRDNLQKEIHEFKNKVAQYKFEIENYKLRYNELKSEFFKKKRQEYKLIQSN